MYRREITDSYFNFQRVSQLGWMVPASSFSRSVLWKCLNYWMSQMLNIKFWILCLDSGAPCGVLTVDTSDVTHMPDTVAKTKDRRFRTVLTFCSLKGAWNPMKSCHCQTQTSAMKAFFSSFFFSSPLFFFFSFCICMVVEQIKLIICYYSLEDFSLFYFAPMWCMQISLSLCFQMFWSFTREMTRLYSLFRVFLKFLCSFSCWKNRQQARVLRMFLFWKDCLETLGLSGSQWC